MCNFRSFQFQGEKLRELLLKHGDFKTVEVEVEKISTQTAKNGVEGGWENKISLTKKGWTEPHNRTFGSPVSDCISIV